MELSDPSENIRARKTRSITFRLDTMLIDELQRDADQAEVSLNVLISQVLRRYVEWDRYEHNLNIIPIPKSILSNVIDETIQLATDAGIKDIQAHKQLIAKHAAQGAFHVIRDSVLFMRKKYNLWTVLDVLRNYMKVSGISSDHKIEPGGRHIFIIQHDLGDNWSLFAEELLSTIFIELAQVKADISTTPKTIKAEVILKEQ